MIWYTAVLHIIFPAYKNIGIFFSLNGRKLTQSFVDVTAAAIVRRISSQPELAVAYSDPPIDVASAVVEPPIVDVAAAVAGHVVALVVTLSSALY